MKNPLIQARWIAAHGILALLCPALGSEIIAHRGGRQYGPENTLPTAAYSCENGADCIEMDVRQTADGHLVIMHDETVDRTTNGTGKVRAMSREQFQALDAGYKWGAAYQGYHPPTLQELFAFAKERDIRLSLDMKEVGSAELLRAEVTKAELEEPRLDIQLWDSSETSTYQRLFPSAVVILISSGRPTHYNEKAMASLREQGADGILFWGAGFSQAEIDYAHQQGIKVQCINGVPDTVQDQVDAGLDGFMTDYPVECMKAYRSKSWAKWVERHALKGLAAAAYADPDRDDQDNLTEYALGTDPALPQPPIKPLLLSDGQDRLVLEFPTRPLRLRHVLVRPLLSRDLLTWEPCARSRVRETANGHLRVHLAGQELQEFVRLRFQFRQ